MNPAATAVLTGSMTDRYSPNHHQQNQQRTQQGIEEKLDGCVLPARTTPQPDQEIHGQEHKLEEQEKQEEVEGDEAAHDRSG